MALVMDRISLLFLLLIYSASCYGKLMENKTTPPNETKIPNKMSGGAGIMFADELKQTLERYLFGICPQNYKMALGKAKNVTVPTCDIDVEQRDLAGRLASLSLRALTAGRGDCSRLGAAMANTFGELARTASNKQLLSVAQQEAIKKRKLSKSQKAKIQAKQKTAIAVKKKAAAVAAAAAAKISA